MNESPPVTVSVEEELRRLRKQLRTTQIGGIVVAVTLLVALVQPPRALHAIRARSLEIVDEDGESRIKLQADELLGSSISLHDDGGNRVASLAGSRDGAHLNLGEHLNDHEIVLLTDHREATFEFIERIADEDKTTVFSPRGIGRWEKNERTFTLNFLDD